MKVKTRRVSGLTGSQRDYGLVTGSVWNYEDKPTSNNVGTTLSPVPRDEATIEAERGETVVGDLDNDGMVEHAKIGGKRHSHGGTPLNVPDGSFVFSDYRGLLIKNGDVLKNIFGMNSGKAVTPAKVAQRYEINKFKDMLNDPFVDPIDRKTAQLMIDNNMRKLGQLALIQEGMKGFPDGIPAIAMPLMGSDFAQQGGQQKMRKGGIVSYKRGGLARYQGMEESQVQIPLRPRGSILSPNTDPSIAMPMGNWELIGTDPDLGDVYQNERGEQIANIDGNWSHLMHGPEAVRPQAAMDYNQDAYNDAQDAAYQAKMMENVFGDANYQLPVNDDIAYQTLEYKTPGTPAYYAHNAANIFTNPGSALMYALDPREKNSTFDAYLQNNNNPIGDVLDIGAATQTGLLPWLGAELFKYDIEKSDPYNFEERAKDKNVNLAGPGEGWKAAAGTALTLGVAAALGWGAKKIGGKKALLNYRKKLFPELYNSRVQPIYELEKRFTPGQKKAVEQWVEYGEKNQRVERFFKNKEFKKALEEGNTTAKNMWEYAYGNGSKTFPRYLNSRFGPQRVIDFSVNNPWARRAINTGDILSIPLTVGLYNEIKPSTEFSDEEIAKGQNTLKSSDWTTIEDAKQDSIAAWAKTQGVADFKSLPDSAKSKWTAMYLQQLNDARTAVSDSISTAADDIGGKVEAITADSNATSFNYKDPSFQKFYTESLQAQGYSPNDYPFDKLPEKNRIEFINAFNSGSKKKDEVKEKAVEKKSVKVKLPAKEEFEDLGTNRDTTGSYLRINPAPKKKLGGGLDRYDGINNSQVYTGENTTIDRPESAIPQDWSGLSNYQILYAPEGQAGKLPDQHYNETLGYYTTTKDGKTQKIDLSDFYNRQSNILSKYDDGGLEGWKAASVDRNEANRKKAVGWFQKNYDDWRVSVGLPRYFFGQSGDNAYGIDELLGQYTTAAPGIVEKPKVEEKKKEEEKKVVADSQDIYPPQFQKTQKRRLPNPRLADLMGEWGAAMQEIRRYPSMYAPVNNAPTETIYQKYNPQNAMAAYTTALQNAGTGPDSAKSVDNIAGKVMEAVAQGQQQTEEQINNPRFLQMLSQNLQAKVAADRYNAGEKIRFQDDVSSKWQDYLANYNKKLANVTEKAAMTAENRYKLGLMQAMYPYANLNFDEFPTANATLNSITDEPVTASSTTGSDSFSTMQQKAYDYYLKQGMSPQEASKAAIEHIKAQMAYNKMYSGTAMSPFTA